MRKNIWQEKLSAFKENEQPEATLMIAGQTELMRIALAWKQTEVSRGRRLRQAPGQFRSRHLGVALEERPL